MQPLDMLQQIRLPLRLEFAVGTFDVLGQVDFSDVIPEVAHGAGRVLADGAVVPVLHAVVELDQRLRGVLRALRGLDSFQTLHGCRDGGLARGGRRARGRGRGSGELGQVGWVDAGDLADVMPHDHVSLELGLFSAGEGTVSAVVGDAVLDLDVLFQSGLPGTFEIAESTAEPPITDVNLLDVTGQGFSLGRLETALAAGKILSL